MQEGWLKDANDHWVWRFHRDDSPWVREPKVFIDRGRQMPEGPPLLKERRSLRKDAEEQFWRSSDAGVQEDETAVGCKCRTLSRPFCGWRALPVFLEREHDTYGTALH